MRTQVPHSNYQGDMQKHRDRFNQELDGENPERSSWLSVIIGVGLIAGLLLFVMLIS